MTRILLLRYVTVTTVLLFTVILFAFYAYFHSSEELEQCLHVAWSHNQKCWFGTYTLLKEFSPIIIAIPAAWLAYCFNRRNSFLTSLNDLWREMVNSKNLCVKYT
jgi:hypothetical protein